MNSKTSAHPVSADGVWREVLRNASTAAPSRPAVFLDRDGTIVEEVHYLHRPADVRLEMGAAKTIREANAAGLAVIVVTNQAGIGRGYYGWDEFAAVQRRMIDLLAAEEARLDMVLACPFHEDAVGDYRVADHPARKPNPGMLIDAAGALRLDLAASFIVGDRASDVTAGRRAGLRGGFLVGTGYGTREADKIVKLAAPGFVAKTAAHLGEAGDIIAAMIADGKSAHGR